MKKLALLAIIGAQGLLAQSAMAQQYSQDLAMCMMSSLTQNDKRVVRAYVVQAIMAHPDFAGKSNFSTADIDRTNRQMGALFTRLIAKNCTSEFVLSTQYEGQAAMEKAFEPLGEYVMTDLKNHPAVQNRAKEITRYVDKTAFERAFKPLLGQ